MINFKTCYRYLEPKDSHCVHYQTETCLILLGITMQDHISNNEKIIIENMCIYFGYFQKYNLHPV